MRFNGGGFVGGGGVAFVVVAAVADVVVVMALVADAAVVVVAAVVAAFDDGLALGAGLEGGWSITIVIFRHRGSLGIVFFFAGCWSPTGGLASDGEDRATTVKSPASGSRWKNPLMLKR